MRRRPGREEGGENPEPLVTREIAAEAAVWIARLHGPQRTRRMERECRAWQARSAAHRLAFERCTDLWMEAAGVNRAAVARAAAASAPRDAARDGRKPWPFAVALAVSALAGVLVFGLWRDDDAYSTGVGEQRLVVLQDGTRLSLNTSTRVRVELGSKRRTVDVEGGEALFEVAKDASRPFVVKAAGSEVRATGTAFVVRYTPALKGSGEALDITLVEGRVVVSAAALRGARHEAPEVEMTPGERLHLAGRARAAEGVKSQVDRPRMDQVLAWKRGEAVFDNTSLSDAVAEMNRYSAMPIRVVDADAVGGLRVSGLFKTGDNASFAHAIATLLGLVVREHADRLELAARPSAAGRDL